MISASPSSNIFSPASTLTTRPTVATGMDTSFFTSLATGSVQLYGTSPIGGIVSPIFPVWFACATWIISIPTSSSILANWIPSSASSPPFPRSVPSGFTVMIGNLYSIIRSGAASLIAATTSRAYLVRFSRLPPYWSSLWFRILEQREPRRRSPCTSIASIPAFCAFSAHAAMLFLISSNCSTVASVTKCCIS